MDPTCPNCGAAVASGERFCAACGTGIAVGPAGVIAEAAPPPASPPPATAQNHARISSARKWLMAISILTLLTGFVFYAIQKSDVEKQIRDAQAQTAGMDPDVRDAAMKRAVGMTFQEAVAHDRGQVNLLLAVNIGLAALYLGMFFWAKRNPLGAATTAFVVFATVIVINAVLDPKTIAQGIIVKVFFILALMRALQAAKQERQAAATPA